MADACPICGSTQTISRAPITCARCWQRIAGMTCQECGLLSDDLDTIRHLSGCSWAGRAHIVVEGQNDYPQLAASIRRLLFLPGAAYV